jgi:molybdenum-dependent DNA-binding transcriptional regulator ModE
MCSPQGSTKLTTLGKMILKREKEMRKEMEFGKEAFNYIGIP